MDEIDDSSSNAEYEWSRFDSEAYFQHYYGDPHVDDEVAIRHACSAILKARPLDRDLDIVDVGTGPNLFPLMCTLSRASRLTAYEYAESNVAWLKKELAGDGLRPQWRHFWDIVRFSVPDRTMLPDNPIERLRAITAVERGSIYDLPANRWDAATMFFCAESITEKQSEFDLACRRFAGCVRPGGSLIAAFLVGSSAYEVADRPFPVLDISEEQISNLFQSIADEVHTIRIGITEQEIRSGYSGMVFLTCRARGGEQIES